MSRFAAAAIRTALADAKNHVQQVQAARHPSQHAFQEQVEALAMAGAKTDNGRRLTLDALRASARSKVTHTLTAKLHETVKPAEAAILGARQLFQQERARAIRPRTIEFPEPTLSGAEKLGLHHTDQQMWLQIRKNEVETQRMRVETERMRIAFETSTMSARDLFEDFAAAEAAGDVVRAEYLDHRIDRAIERMPAPRGKGAVAVNQFLQEKASMAERVAQIRNARLNDQDRQAITELEAEFVALDRMWGTERLVVEAVERRGYVTPSDEGDTKPAPDLQPLGAA